jgi:hypothetical protein
MSHAVETALQALGELAAIERSSQPDTPEAGEALTLAVDPERCLAALHATHFSLSAAFETLASDA